MKTRYLSFIVEDKRIKKDPKCDFTGLVTGTKGIYMAKFSFDKDWREYRKVAVFRTTKITKYVPIVNGMCAVPDEVSDAMMYYVSVIGTGSSVSVPTTEVAVRQTKGGANG